ncbi:MAG: hypothetical protein SVX28_10695, partial [Pseudomonadota bacterium]|nr:hypothetical protein [Pseudomonadota bacterium]
MPVAGDFQGYGDHKLYKLSILCEGVVQRFLNTNGQKCIYGTVFQAALAQMDKPENSPQRSPGSESEGYLH